MVFHSGSEAETVQIAAGFAEQLEPGDLLAMQGGLGMGKTAFVRGLARGLGYSGEVSSPTFALVHEYAGGRLPLYHFDLYRVESFEDLLSCGFYEYAESGGVLAAEWSENIAPWLPEGVYTVRLERGADEDSRVITIERDAAAC